MQQRSSTLFSTLTFIALLAISAQAKESKPIGNPNAPQGGIFSENLGAEPPTINPITATDLGAFEIKDYVLDSLMDRNIETFEWEPRLAEKYEVSKNGKEFTFHLRKDAEFSDGKPVTAEDVKFSFDVYFDPNYSTAHIRPYFESIEKAEVLDPYTVKFTTKELYFKNFEVLAGLNIVPKHIYGDGKVGSQLNKTITGSGPWMIDNYEKGKRLTLKRNPKWWGRKDPKLKGIYNFDEIHERFVKEEQVELEMLKTGQLDYLPVGAEVFMKKMDGEVWDKNVNKFEIHNKSPQPYGFVGWNQNDPLFQDKNVRRALTHLMNRKLMIEKFLFNKSVLATGPWHIESVYASPKVKPIEFDPKKALELLTKAGWTDSDKDGVLDKVINGQKVDFRFTLLNPSKDFEKYLTIFKEDLKKVGIDMELKYVEWNSFLKLVDEFKFQAVVMSWGAGSVDLDPKQVWHSSSAVAGGSNFISYKNPEVDKLIDEARKQMDRNKRIKILQHVYEIIADDAPYTFMFNRKFAFYANRKRVQTPTKTYTFGVGKNYWWLVDKPQ